MFFFEAISLTKHTDIDQYKYSGCGIGFDRKGEFSFGNGYGRNCIIFEVEMSYKKKDILIVGKGPTQGRDGTTLTAEKFYLIKFTENNKNFCLELHYKGVDSYLFVNGTEIPKLKAKDSEIVATPLCLRNI